VLAEVVVERGQVGAEGLIDPHSIQHECPKWS
jgi:hypothetical protein